MRYQLIPIILAYCISVLIFWEKYGLWEGYIFPVTTSFKIVALREEKTFVSFSGEFVKLRNCTFKELQWYKQGVRLAIDFAPDASLFPTSRPVGDQIVGPWTVYGIDSLEGVTAIAKHQCHPAWPTYTLFYPSRAKLTNP